jgi:hypothetical protein
MQARQAAARFIESNAGPDRLMAVVNFTGALQIAQNFTGDIDRLKQVVGGIKTSAVAPGPEGPAWVCRAWAAAPARMGRAPCCWPCGAWRRT